MKRAGDGMHANREVCAVAVIASSRAGRVLSLHDTVRFLGVLVGILRLPSLNIEVTAMQSLEQKSLSIAFPQLKLGREKEKAGGMFG